MIVNFPTRRERPVGTSSGANALDIWLRRMRGVLCRICNRVGVPGAIQDATIDDPLSGQHIEVAVQQDFVKLTVNGRDYYFDRISGKFDGTGMGCG